MRQSLSRPVSGPDGSRTKGQQNGRMLTSVLCSVQVFDAPSGLSVYGPEIEKSKSFLVTLVRTVSRILTIT